MHQDPEEWSLIDAWVTATLTRVWTSNIWQSHITYTVSGYNGRSRHRILLYGHGYIWVDCHAIGGPRHKNARATYASDNKLSARMRSKIG